MKSIVTVLSAAVALLGSAIFAEEALITPTAIVSSTAATDLYPAVNLINGSGLSAPPVLAALGTHAAASSSVSWVTAAFPPNYFDPVRVPPILTCDLPSRSLLTALVIWGYHFDFPSGNEGKLFALSFSTDGVIWDTEEVIYVTSSTPVASGARVLALSRPVVAKYVRVAVGQNHYPVNGGGDRVGLGELRFAGYPSALLVTNNNDSGGGSLRQAVADAKASPGLDTIYFSPQVPAAFGSISLNSEILIDSQVAIDASTIGGFTIDAGPGTNRHFLVDFDYQLILRNLTLIGGGGTGGTSDNGGAILARPGAILRLENCTLTQNSAAVSGGAIYCPGLFSNPIPTQVTLVHTTVTNNAAGLGGSRFGGGVYVGSGHFLTLIDSIIAGNTATAGQGPDLYCSATLQRVGRNIVSTPISGGGPLTGTGGIVEAPSDLAPLGNYGGNVLTCAPVPRGNAINSGLAPLTSSWLAFDQRGAARGSAGWSNDFSSGLQGATVLRESYDGGFPLDPGTAQIDAGSFRLTAPVNSQRSTLVLPNLGTFQSFSASFDFRYTGADPADGVSFNWGPAPGSPVGEPGNGTGHTISINTYGGNTPTGTISYIKNGVLQRTIATFSRSQGSGVWQRFNVELKPNGKLSVIINDAYWQDGIDIPTGYSPTAGDVFFFGARTGGAVAEHRIDNVAVIVNPSTGPWPDVGAVEAWAGVPGYVPVVNSEGNAFDGLSSNGTTLEEAAYFAPVGSTVGFAPALSGKTVHLARTLTPSKNIDIDALGLPLGLTVSGDSNNDGSGDVTQFDVTEDSTLRLFGLTLTRSGGLGAVINRGRTDLSRCTVSGNFPTWGRTLFNSASGALALDRCTLSGNAGDAPFPGDPFAAGGGAIMNLGIASLNHCTVSANRTANSGGGIFNYSGANLVLTNSIVSGNSLSPGSGGLGPDIYNLGTVSLTDTNLVQVTSQGAGLAAAAPGATTLTGDARLAPLADYGGPTWTMALRPGSPARNVATVFHPSNADQRGMGQVGAPDLGAYEAGTFSANYNAYIWESLPTAGNGTTTDPLHARAFDYDGDGQTNEQEFVTLTNAGDPSSAFRVTTAGSGGTRQLSFPTAGGRTYSVKRSDNLATGGWTASGLPASLTGDGTVKQFTVPGPGAGVLRRFYRIEVSQ